MNLNKCLALLIAVLANLHGCAPDFVPVKLVPVSGKITSTKPVEYKSLGVMFVNDKGGASGSAKVEADGTFSGEAPVGAAVAYLYGAPSEGSNPAGGHADSSKSKTNKGFWNAETSPWKMDIPDEGKKDITLSLDDKISSGGGAMSHGAR